MVYFAGSLLAIIFYCLMLHGLLTVACCAYLLCTVAFSCVFTSCFLSNSYLVLLAVVLSYVACYCLLFISVTYCGLLLISGIVIR